MHPLLDWLAYITIGSYVVGIVGGMVEASHTKLGTAIAGTAIIVGIPSMVLLLLALALGFVAAR